MRIILSIFIICKITMTADDPIPEDEICDIPDSEIAADEELNSEDLDMEDMDMGIDLGAVLTTDDGDTVCSALVDASNAIVEVAKQLATQNKILIKILAKLT